jgi:hypothetical protein
VGWVMLKLLDFEQLSGRLQAFESSPGIKRSFCSDCGIQITYLSQESPDTIDITSISLDNPLLFSPTREV